MGFGEDALVEIPEAEGVADGSELGRGIHPGGINDGLSGGGAPIEGK